MTSLIGRQVMPIGVYKIIFNVKKELNINVCNSGNPDLYNLVYAFMQILDIKVYTGLDEDAVWNPKLGDYVRNNGEYGRTLTNSLDPAYYVKNISLCDGYMLKKC